MKYLVSIGLETHVQLKTRTKMFCGCLLSTDCPPNTNVCPVCMGLPGALPLMNKEAIRKTVMSGLMLGCSINKYSRFDRKNYFYPDMVKNYQISQNTDPLCIGGGVDIGKGENIRRVRINHIHLEEDAAKINHYDRHSGIDYNRCGTPLMEIVSEPDMHSSSDAMEYLTALRQILVYAGVSDCNLEDGNMRSDVNVSVRPETSDRLGTKVEIKNMNTFKGICAALEFEIDRQTAILKSGGSVVQETRRWDGECGETFSMRTKENAHDYRYFPEPDLLPVMLDDGTIEQWRSELPELPGKKRERFKTQYSLPEYDAGVLCAQLPVAAFFEQTVQRGAAPKSVSNWIMTDLLRLLGQTGRDISDIPLTPDSFASLLKLVDSKSINTPTAKELFEELFEKGGAPETIVKERGLGQVSDTGAIEEFAARVVAENPKVAADYVGGKAPALQYLVGQVMKLSRGKANPQMAAEIIKRKIAGE